jgi:hypothetical protein
VGLWKRLSIASSGGLSVYGVQLDGSVTRATSNQFQYTETSLRNITAKHKFNLQWLNKVNVKSSLYLTK